AGSAEVRRACQVLAKWDRRFDVGSRGALLFTRYWQLLGTPDWQVPFDAADPLRTPRDPKPDLKALGDAVAWMRTAGVPLDARLGDRQYVADGGRRIPIPGGGIDDGLNVLEGEWDGGHLVPAYGNTYIQQVSFNDTGCPGVRTLLTYGQAADPTSPHHTDQTRLYSTDRWVTPSLCGGARVVETIKITSS
ncbi:penicillin acylase family protein, partial [Streptomyces anulatus]|uniref:penicillin acylase family protein n=1 Tax=Streptomyces anulatus TaxID=1892 RepID=UPI00343735FB